MPAKMIALKRAALKIVLDDSTVSICIGNTTISSLSTEFGGTHYEIKDVPAKEYT
jgi:hypothetical protein